MSAIEDALGLRLLGRAAPPFGHLTEDTHALLNAPLERRLDRIDEDIFIPWHFAESALRELARLFRLPEGTRRPIMLLVGESGQGKSTLLDEFMQRHGIDRESFIGKSGRQELFVLSLAGLENGDEFHYRILRHLGEPVPSSRDAKKSGLLDISAAALLRSKPRLFVYEECQSLARVQNPEVEKVLESIRHISNVTRRPIAMLGSAEMDLPLRRSRHTATRFERFVLPAWTDIPELRSFVDAELSHMPLPQPSPITDDVSLHRLIGWSNGVTEYIVKTLRRACREAIYSERDCITFDLLDQSKTLWTPPPVLE